MIDDDDALSEALVLLMEADGYEVSRIGDGKKAIEEIKKWGPKVVILDYMLPGKNGIEILKEIRCQTNGIAKLPVVMISASVNVRGQAKDNGANVFLAKPFEIEDLVDATSKLMAK